MSETITFIRLSREEILKKLSEQDKKKIFHTWRLLSDPLFGTIDCKVVGMTRPDYPVVIFEVRKIEKEMEPAEFFDIRSALDFLEIK